MFNLKLFLHTCLYQNSTICYSGRNHNIIILITAVTICYEICLITSFITIILYIKSVAMTCMIIFFNFKKLNLESSHVFSSLDFLNPGLVILTKNIRRFFVHTRCVRSIFVFLLFTTKYFVFDAFYVQPFNILSLRKKFF
jgi:hypothetical protein